MTSRLLVSDAGKHSLLLPHVCSQDSDKSCLENGHVQLCSSREVALKVSSSTHIYAQKASQAPEVSSENMVMIPYSMKIEPLQFEGETKKPQFLHDCNDSLDTGAPLSVLPCEVLSETENYRLLEPLSNWSTSKSLDSLHLYERMNLHFFEDLNSSSNIGLRDHQNQENDLYGTNFHTSQNMECSGLMKVKFGQPIFTYTNSSNTIKSTTSGARQLEQFLESPVNSVSDQSSKVSLIQMGDELSAALISGFRSDFGKCESRTQNEAKKSCSFNEVELVSGQTCIESDGDGFDFPSLRHEMIDSNFLGLSLFSESKEDLLDAVVAGFPSSGKPSSYSVTIDEIPSQLDYFKEANLRHTLTKPHEKTSEELEFSYDSSGYQLEDSKQISSSTAFRNSTNATSKKELISMVQNLVKDESGRHCKEICLKQENQEEKPKTSRKRSRTEKTSRPRPKDRQQIQDRVRELRVIVPNANKCSIDALLLRTIAYIKFLHTITQHGGRWSYKGKIKIARNEAMTVLSEESKHGASWVVDLGAHGEIQGRQCPINVENLSQPGQMLVEILCEEEGIFLEIANNIRELGLTILKGVMEVRNGHIWARFVVESVRDIHRLEVLWSLTHILESVANKRENTGISN